MINNSYNALVKLLPHLVLTRLTNDVDPPIPDDKQPSINMLAEITDLKVYTNTLPTNVQISNRIEDYFQVFQTSHIKFHKLLNYISVKYKKPVTYNYLGSVKEQYNIICLGIKIHTYERYNVVKVEHLYIALMYLYYALNLIEPSWDCLQVTDLRNIYTNTNYHIIKRLIFDIASKDVCIDGCEVFSEARQYLLGFKVFS